MLSPRLPRPIGARKKSKHDRALPDDGIAVSNGYFKSFDGTQLFYSIEGQGTPLIFCYGLVCSSLHWTYQIEHFRRDHRAIWFDYRGHHNSEIPHDLSTLTLSNLARDLGILCDELQIRDAVFLGHSMGVNVLLEFYRQQPHRFKGLVLANGTPKPPLETLFGSNAFQKVFEILKRTDAKSPTLVKTVWKLLKGNPVARTLISIGGFNTYLTPEEDIELYVDQVAEMDPRVLIELVANYEKSDATPYLQTIGVPTLIIAGEKDRITPLSQQELMHQLIPDSELEVIRHGSHCPQMDLPELVNHKIEDFLKKIQSS